MIVLIMDIIQHLLYYSYLLRIVRICQHLIPILKLVAFRLVKEYKSANHAARENNIQFTNICKVCRGERKTAGGFGWSYTKAESIEPIKTKRLGDCTVLQFTKEGEFIAEYSSSKEARRQTGVNNTTIGLVCKGKNKTAGGFVWKYKNETVDRRCKTCT